MKEILHQIESEIESTFQGDSSGHDLYHLKRVLNTALHIHEKEGGDRLTVAASALLHDLHRIVQNETGEYCSPKDSLPAVKTILDKTTISKEQKVHILHCVEYHEEYSFSENGKRASDLETLILQDADNLDAIGAIGAIGIARTFAFGGSHGVPMWTPEVPFDGEHYDNSVKDPSVIHHFYSKLLKLKDNMHTKTAKELAESRDQFMERFVKEFIGEWNGEQ